MSEFSKLIQQRRSHRRFATDAVDEEKLKLILRAALMSPTAKGQRAWNFFVVSDPEGMKKLSKAKSMGGDFLAEAPLAIVVTGNSEKNDCWVEDGSIAAFAMQLQAEDLGLGTCWVQMRGRGGDDGVSANAAIHRDFDIPAEQEVLCVLAVGTPTDERKPQNEDRLKWEQVGGLQK